MDVRMQISSALRRALVVFLASGVAGISTLRAQGITTAAVSGVVTDSVGQSVEAARIQVINQSTGVRSGTLTRANGNFYVQGVEVGGPYTVSVRRL